MFDVEYVTRGAIFIYEG